MGAESMRASAVRVGSRGAVVALMVALTGTVGGCASSTTGTPGPDTSSTATSAPASTPASTSSSTSVQPSLPSPSTPSSPSRTPTTGTPTPTTSPTTPSPAPFDPYTAYVTVSSLNLRAAASSDAAVSSALSRGDRVQVTGKDVNGFTPIRHDGDAYWVTSGYLSRNRPEPLPASVKAPVRTMYTTTVLNVRVHPLAGSQLLGTLESGARITTAGAVAGSWTSITYQGGTGWVRSQYLTTNRPAPTSPTTGVALDKRCTTGLVVCISKSDRQLRLVQDGKILISLDARFGSEEGPTREGTFTIGWRSKDWVSTIYGSKMPYAMFFSGGQAIHYSSDFAARGYAGNSHGCVNIRSMGGIQYVWNHAPVGTTVVVYR